MEKKPNIIKDGVTNIRYKNGFTLKELEEKSDMTVFICAMNEVEKMGYLFKNRYDKDRGNTRFLVNHFLEAGRWLTKKFDSMMDGTDDLHVVSESFGIMFDIARKQDEKRLLELVALIKEWDSGNIKIVE